MCTVVTAAELSPSKLNKEHSTTLETTYGILFVYKIGVISPEISETVFSGVNLLSVAKQLIFMALTYFKKLIKKNFDGNNANIINRKA